MGGGGEKGGLGRNIQSHDRERGGEGTHISSYIEVEVDASCLVDKDIVRTVPIHIHTNNAGFTGGGGTTTGSNSSRVVGDPVICTEVTTAAELQGEGGREREGGRDCVN